MTPNDVQQELRDQLSDHGLPADRIDTDLTAHKRRLDASIDSATSTMSMRVQRAMNAQRSALRPRAARLALAMTANAATVVMVVTYRPENRTSTDVADSTFIGTTSTGTAEHDVDALTDELVRRNSASTAGWAVTDDDVDQLLGEDGLDL